MKMRTLLVALALCVGINVQAQKKEKEIDLSGFTRNWFVQIQAGAAHTVGELDFGELLSPAVAISVGRNFTPFAGARLQVGGFQGKGGWNYNQEAGGKVDYKWNQFHAALDGLFNLSNIIGSYRERNFDLIGILGVGYMRSFDYDEIPYLDNTEATNLTIARLGLQANWKLNKALAFNVEFNANGLPDAFNQKIGSTNDYHYQALLGLTYKFANKKYVAKRSAADDAIIRRLNNQIDEQQKQIADLKANPVEKIVTKVVEVDNGMKGYLVFNIGKSALMNVHHVCVYEMAQYLKQNSEAKLTIRAYADVKTGNAKINENIANKRGNTVANELVSKYGIAKDRITIEVFGDRQQPYSENAWNRVVIMEAKK